MKKRILSFLMAFALILGGLVIPSDGAHAANFSVTAGMADDLSYQYFYITTDDPANTRYDLYASGFSSEGNPIPTDGMVKLDDISIDYLIYVYELDAEGNRIEETEVSAISLLSHDYDVVYNLYDASGNLVTQQYAETGYVGIADAFIFTADSIVVNGDYEYDLISGYSQVQVKYGQKHYSFDYQIYSPEPDTAYVYYVDDRGNVLKTNSIPVEYYGDDVTFNVEQHITVDGRDYTKLSGPDTITVNYFSPVLDYDIVYVEDAPAVEYPYTVKVNYIDSATGAVLGNQYETITAEDGTYDEVQFYAPDSLEVSSDGVVSYYHAQDPLVSHVPDGTVRTYDVYYDLFDQETPYYWNIRLVDSVTGTLLGEDYIEIGVDETATYTPDVQLDVNGTNYLLDSSMAATYERHYDDTSSRILYIYYNEEGAVVDSEQTLNISFRSVSDDTVLYSEEVTVPAGESYTLEIPETYSLDDTEYVVLAGQGSVIEHNYYSPQRNYTVYYRDVNDLQNVDTVVTREEIVYYDNPITEQEIVYEDQYIDEVVPEEADDAVTVLANDTTGDVVTLDDEGTPLAENPNDNAETVTLEDEETPLAEGPETSADADDAAGNDAEASADSTTTIEDETTPLGALPVEADSDGSSVNMPLIIGGVAVVAVVIIAGVCIAVIRKKNSAK